MQPRTWVHWGFMFKPLPDDQLRALTELADARDGQAISICAKVGAELLHKGLVEKDRHGRFVLTTLGCHTYLQHFSKGRRNGNPKPSAHHHAPDHLKLIDEAIDHIHAGHRLFPHNTRRLIRLIHIALADRHLNAPQRDLLSGLQHRLEHLRVTASYLAQSFASAG